MTAPVNGHRPLFRDSCGFFNTPQPLRRVDSHSKRTLDRTYFSWRFQKLLYKRFEVTRGKVRKIALTLEKDDILRRNRETDVFNENLVYFVVLTLYAIVLLHRRIYIYIYTSLREIQFSSKQFHSRESCARLKFLGRIFDLSDKQLSYTLASFE